MNNIDKKFFQTFLTLENDKEVRAFLLDLLTEQEVLELSKRFQAARMLSEGNSYIEIEKDTGLSSTTIARVSKSLNSEEGGYRMILARVKK